MELLDDETKKDLMDAFQDLTEEAEQHLNRLLEGWDDAAINSLFRAVHNIKGNAGIMQLPVIVDFTHVLEEVVGALRLKRFAISEYIAEAILIGLDRLQDLHHAELYGKKFDYLRIDELQVLFNALACAERDEVESVAVQLLQFLGAGIGVSSIDLFLSEPKPDTASLVWVERDNSDCKITDDLIFFQDVAFSLDAQIESWLGRSLQLFDWAMRLNGLAGAPVNEKQLAAAIYLHDIGMALMPRDLWAKKLELNPAEVASVAQHAQFGYNYLIRIPGWEEAATIILQHHECVNGSGYPNGLSDQQIHPGAKILAVLDAFFFLTNGPVDVNSRRSTVRAVSAINARIDTAFDGMWVQCFNHLIRTELEDGNV